jgi:hypothetical protein
MFLAAAGTNGGGRRRETKSNLIIVKPLAPPTRARGFDLSTPLGLPF